MSDFCQVNLRLNISKPFIISAKRDISDLFLCCELLFVSNDAQSFDARRIVLLRASIRGCKSASAFFKEKQAKNRNETASNLSFGARLTRVKRLSRKHCCDTTPDRYQEGSRLTILFRIS